MVNSHSSRPIPTMSLTWLAANGCTSLVDHCKDPRWAKTVALRRIVALKWWLLSCAAVRPCQAVTNPQAMNPAMAQQYPWDRSQVMLTLWIVVGMVWQCIVRELCRISSCFWIQWRSMKINEVCSHDFKVLHVSVIIRICCNAFLPPICTSRLCWPAQSDLENVRRLMMIDEHGINVCRNVVSFPPWTQCARFLSLAAFNIDDIEIPRSTQVVAIAWVYGTPMLLWQEALAVRQGLLPWDTLRIVSSREIMSPIRHSMSRSMPLSTIPIHIQRSTNIHSHSYPQLSIAIHAP